MEKTVARIALFAALIAALGLVPQITIPFAGGVPITAQTLGVMLAGLILGPWRGALAVLVFIPGDILKAVIASFIAREVGRARPGLMEEQAGRQPRGGPLVVM